MFLSTQGLLNNLKTQSLLAGYETMKRKTNRAEQQEKLYEENR